MKETVQALTDLTGTEVSTIESKLAEQIAHVRQTHTWPVLTEQWVPWLSRLWAGPVTVGL